MTGRSLGPQEGRRWAGSAILRRTMRQAREAPDEPAADERRHDVVGVLFLFTACHTPRGTMMRVVEEAEKMRYAGGAASRWLCW